jgi:hypothetical protein
MKPPGLFFRLLGNLACVEQEMDCKSFQFDAQSRALLPEIQ